MIKNITYEDKIAIQNDESVDRKNKVTDADMNEIKEVVNANADEQTTQNTDISNIKKEQEKQNTNIEENNSKIVELQNEKAELEKELKEAQEDFYQASIRGQASGEYIHVEDSSNCRSIIGISGNHEQETRSGKNYLNTLAKYKAGDTVTIEGITYTFNNDGSITCNGTASATANSNLDFSVDAQKINGTNKKIVGLLTGSQVPSKMALTAYTSTWGANPTLTFSEVNKSLTINMQSNAEYTIFRISVYRGTTVNNQTVYYQILDTSETDLTYEQYGVSPSPDYPSEIETVGDNLNLLDIDKTTYDLTINLQKEGEYLKGNNVNIIRIGTFNDSRPQIEEKFKSGNYTISYEVEANSNVTILNLFLCVIYEDDTQENVGSGKSYSLEEGTKQKVFWTLNVQKNVKKMGIVSYLSNSCDIIVSKVKIEKGLIATPYSPYGMGSVEIKISNNDNTQSQTAIMPTQAEMLENDYFDYDNEEEVHVWNKLILNGTENWEYDSTYNYFRCPSYVFDKIPSTASEDVVKQLSNYFSVVRDWGIFRSNTNLNGFSPISNAGYRLVIRNTNYKTVDTFKTWLKLQYDAGTPVTIYYKQETPTRLAFTDEQKEVAKELSNARTYKNVTNITTDSKAILSLDYAKDLETLLTSKGSEV